MSVTGGVIATQPNCQLTHNDDIKLETTLQELVLDLLGNRVETDVGLGADFFSHFG